MKRILTTTILAVLVASCASYNAFERGRTAERAKDWDDAVLEYQKALEVDPGNMRYQIYLQRAKLEASRVHFEKGKTLRQSASATKGMTLCGGMRLRTSNRSLPISVSTARAARSTDSTRVNGS